VVDLVELKDGGPGLHGAGRVLPAAQAAALLDIVALRAAAEREAAAMLASAKAEVDRVREAARQEGLAQAEAEIQDRLFEIAEASVNVIARTEERIIGLGLQVARKILGEFEEAELVARIAAKGLRLAAHSSVVRLRVAPHLVDATNARLAAMIGATMPVSAVQVVADARMRDGGCVLETDAGLIDATLESQLAAIERGLKRSLAQSSGAEG
jgi:type III secretion protein L